MAVKFDKVWAYDKKGGLKGSLYGRFKNTHDAVWTILTKRFNLSYFGIDYFAEWSFSVSPTDKNKEIIDVKLADNGCLYLKK